MDLYCSFCGKTDKEVKHLIAAPDVFICDECVDLCAEIIAVRAVKKTKDFKQTDYYQWAKRKTGRAG